MSTVGVRRRRALATVVLAALIVAVPLGVYAWGRTSGTFRVGHIEVSGARPGHARAVRLVLRRRFLGANLFTVTAARVRAALAGFPFVDRVAIDRDFPDTLKVRMTEYVPAALLWSGDRWYVVSTEGRVLAETAIVPGRRAHGRHVAGAVRAGLAGYVSFTCAVDHGAGLAVAGRPGLTGDLTFAFAVVDEPSPAGRDASCCRAARAACR